MDRAGEGTPGVVEGMGISSWSLSEAGVLESSRQKLVGKLQRGQWPRGLAF